MSIKKEEPKDLLAELEMLQRVLENSHSSNDNNTDFSGEIPVLDDLFEADIPTLSTVSTAGTLRPVSNLASTKLATNSPYTSKATQPVETVKSTSTPGQLSPLNQILDKINKQGASIDEIASVTTSTTQSLANKRAELDATMTQTSTSLTNLLQRERLVDELVEEMLPLVKGRLRSRIREMINQEKIDKSE